MDIRAIDNYFESGRLTTPDVLNAKATARHGGFLKELQRRLDSARPKSAVRSKSSDQKKRTEMERYFPGLSGKKTKLSQQPRLRESRPVPERSGYSGREDFGKALQALGAPGTVSTARIEPRSTIAFEIRNSPEHRRLYEAAQDFQAIFIRMLLKSMRSTLDRKADLLHGGRSQEIFEDMLYDEYSEVMSRQGTFKISDLLYRQLAPGLAAKAANTPQGRGEPPK